MELKEAINVQKLLDLPKAEVIGCEWYGVTISGETIVEARHKLIELAEKVPTLDELRNLGVDLIDKHFPKGECKERGAAIVLFAELIITIHERIVGGRK